MRELNSGENNGFFGKHHSEDTIKKNREAHLGKPAWNKGVPMTDKAKTHLSEVSRGRKASDETKRKMSESHKKNPVQHWKGKKFPESMRCNLIKSRTGEKNHQWKGGISFEPYCPKFNEEFKNRVRAFFNYTCIECGTPQNGRKLDVHHITANKMSCCDNTVPLFIALCVSCHSKVRNNQEYWERYFIEMLEQYYQGKCYFTREEFESLKTGKSDMDLPAHPATAHHSGQS